MDCYEVQSKMKPFIRDSLSGKDLESFLVHLKSCEACRTEAEVQLLSDKLANETDSTDYDFRGLLSETIAKRERKLRREKVLWSALFLIAFFTVAVFAYLFMTF